MSRPTRIRILESDSNRRGDLFGRLMSDLFIALGYEQPRVNIHKTGREIDLEADHRQEPRRAIAECKATAEPIGADAINKFVGVLDVEKKGRAATVAYFISLSGFRESATQQEIEGRRTKIILLTGEQAVAELIEGRIIISPQRASEMAGRLSSGHKGLTLDPSLDLLVHDRGWIWALYYTTGGEHSHFALIHADGTPLAKSIAAEVIESDASVGGPLRKLRCLNPTGAAEDAPDTDIKEAILGYYRYVQEECGYMLLDGLPADSDVGSRRLRLENLFVPAHLDVPSKGSRLGVGSLLTPVSRMAILAPPGGGKSTLLRRLAVAYSDPDRRKNSDDQLPEHDWLPLFFRCRELRQLARGSFSELLDALADREHVRRFAKAFRTYVDKALLDGRVLLLVDGLDEISDPGDRAAFVCTLRTALQAYPQTSILATSREAGFRHVAAHLAHVCTHSSLSPFNNSDLRRLTVAWHVEVVGNTEKVRRDADVLANSIIRDDRIRRLATNPLLLTTLLLVQRWLGSLPTRRAVLYDKAAELLLMTWNTEGYEPIPVDEALPQLCYLAATMMLRGIQKISRPQLALVIQEARDALPTELGYVKGTVDDFIRRVEYRSSLLMMMGHDLEGGRLVEFFEFRHLTFQEFLTARAMVEGWHPNRKSSDTLMSVLHPHLADEKWREVIPLAAVLGGKETEVLMRGLHNAVWPSGAAKKYDALKKNAVFLSLARSLADEAAAHPTTIRSIVSDLVRVAAYSDLDDVDFGYALARGKYGSVLREEAERLFFSMPQDYALTAKLLYSICLFEHVFSDDIGGDSVALKHIEKCITCDDSAKKCWGALALAHLCSRLESMREDVRSSLSNSIHDLGRLVIPLLFSDDPAQQYSAAKALGWLGAARAWSIPMDVDIIGRFFYLWRSTESVEVGDMASWAIATQKIMPRDLGVICSKVAVRDFDLFAGSLVKKNDVVKMTSLMVLSWYLKLPENTTNARILLSEYKKMDPIINVTLTELVAKMGNC